MSAGEVPAAEAISVLRLIHKSFFKDGLAVPVQPEAFRPTNRDDDGLSVFTEPTATPEVALCAVPAEKRHMYYVARLSIGALKTLNLSLKDSPIAEVPGHAVIPELNALTYNQSPESKLAGKVLQKQLAEIASANIVYRPPTIS